MSGQRMGPVPPGIAPRRFATKAMSRSQTCEKDVTFEAADPAIADQIDTAYRNKYRRHGAQYVNSVTTAEARSTTIKLVPREVTA